MRKSYCALIVTVDNKYNNKFHSSLIDHVRSYDFMVIVLFGVIKFTYVFESFLHI